MRYTTRWLRVEALGILVAVLILYAATGSSWILFAVFLLGPDVGMLGYLVSPRVGAISYNLVHLYLWPALLLALWVSGAAEWALPAGLIWAAHIAMDRAFGYGLKEPDAFKHTHLGWIGGRDEGATGSGRSRR